MKIYLDGKDSEKLDNLFSYAKAYFILPEGYFN